MYNYFAANKDKQKKREFIIKKRISTEYQRNYKKELQPLLINRFNRRLNGFVKKMESQPSPIKVYKDPLEAHHLFRQDNNEFNISKNHFKFKNSEDWKSIYPSIQRIRHAEEQKKAKGCKVGLYKSLFAQKPYEYKSVEFRRRDASKDINPPMKYTYQYSPNSITKNLKSGTAKQKQQFVKNQEDYNFSVYSEDKGNLSEMDLATLEHQLKIGAQKQGMTDAELQEQEELKALAQKKFYFKSLMSLEYKCKSKGEARTLKQILRKCKVIQSEKTVKEKQEEKDNFENLVSQKY